MRELKSQNNNYNNNIIYYDLSWLTQSESTNTLQQEPP